jgi:hypothetical protein
VAKLLYGAIGGYEEGQHVKSMPGRIVNEPSTRTDNGDNLWQDGRVGPMHRVDTGIAGGV